MSRRRSNTVGNKIDEEYFQQDKINHLSLLSQSSKIKVIMRRTSKLARIVEIPTILTTKQLFQIVEKQFYIPSNQQIIFIKNQRYQLQRDIISQILIFNQKDIIHVHNRQIVQRQLTCIYLQFLNTQLIKYRQAKIETKSSEIILNAFQDSLIYEVQDIEKYLFAQSSRHINIMHSFLRQAIQDGSIIIAIPKQHGKQISLSKLQQREIQILQSRMKLTKKTSLHLINTDNEIPNFKKKFQFHIYKSMILPGSKQIIWKEDNTPQISKSILIKKLIKKRNKIDQIVQIQQQDSYDDNNIDNRNQIKYQKKVEQKIFTINNRQMLQQQHFSKLYDIKNLKPPAIGNDLLQQIQDCQLKYYFIQNSYINNNILNGNLLKNNYNSSFKKRKNTQHTFSNLNSNLKFPDDGNQIMEI